MLSISVFVAWFESVIGFWALAVTVQLDQAHLLNLLAQGLRLETRHEVINNQRRLLTLINRKNNNLFTAYESSQVACFKHYIHSQCRVIRNLTANNQLPTTGYRTAEKKLSC